MLLSLIVHGGIKNSRKKHQTLYFSVTPHMSSLGNKLRYKTLLNTSLFPDDELRSASHATLGQDVSAPLQSHGDGGRLLALHPRTGKRDAA